MNRKMEKEATGREERAIGNGKGGKSPNLTEPIAAVPNDGF